MGTVFFHGGKAAGTWCIPPTPLLSLSLCMSWELYLCVLTVPVEAYHWVTFTFAYTYLSYGVA